MDEKKCQMTVSYPMFPDCPKTSPEAYSKCGKPAKFRNPEPQMGVVFVCGIHARSLDAHYKRIGSGIRCIPLKMEVRNV